MYCAETVNIVLSFVTDVHFLMVLLLACPSNVTISIPIWRFCNPVRIYGRKIDDDDDDVYYYYYTTTTSDVTDSLSLLPVAMVVAVIITYNS